MLARPDALVFPLAAVDHLVLRHPSRGVADIRQDAVSLLDADLDVVLPACPDMADAILEGRRGLPARMDEAVEKLAVREPRLADAVLAHLDFASGVFPGRPALVGLVGRWARPLAAAALYIPDEAPFAA
ncbi:MAG TPA: hypothetical protein VNM37_06075 [Candidatus Dormibacteraeota bacterium]|nr:hypothetical protein [Candidatus Dormibacteraeota bacterium]